MFGPLPNDANVVSSLTSWCRFSCECTSIDFRAYIPNLSSRTAFSTDEDAPDRAAQRERPERDDATYLCPSPRSVRNRKSWSPRSR